MVFYLFCQGKHIPNVFADIKWRLESTDLAIEIEKKLPLDNQSKILGWKPGRKRKGEVGTVGKTDEKRIK